MSRETNPFTSRFPFATPHSSHHEHTTSLSSDVPTSARPLLVLVNGELRGSRGSPSMGVCSSAPLPGDALEATPNDYELVIRVAKYLDVALSRHALLASSHVHEAKDHQSPGLHERITAAHLPHELEKRLRFLATVRNALVHDPLTTKLADRPAFVAAFVTARASLRAREGADAARGATAVGPAAPPSGGCAIA